MDNNSNPNVDVESKFYDKNPGNLYIWKVVMTRLSFLYLLIGYLISIYGDISGYKKNIALLDILKCEGPIFVITIIVLIIWTELIKKTLK